MIAGRVVFSGRCNRCFHNQMIDRRLPAGNAAERNKKRESYEKDIINFQFYPCHFAWKFSKFKCSYFCAINYWNFIFIKSLLG